MTKVYNIGDKVIPLKKSVIGPIEGSLAFKTMQKEGLKFLYVMEVYEKDNRLALWHDLSDSKAGDFFSFDDVIPFVENDHSEYSITISGLNQMVKDGLLKESDEFIVRRA